MINSKMFFRQRNIFILIIIVITSIVISTREKFDSISNNSNTRVTAQTLDMGLMSNIRPPNNSIQNGDFSLTTDLNNIIEIKGHEEVRL